MNSANVNTTLENMRSISVLIFVIFMIMLSQYMFNKLPAFTNTRILPTAFIGVIGGVVVAVVSYLPIKYLYGKVLIDESYTVNLTILLGIICAYMMVSGINGMPDIPTIALLVFLFYHQVQKFIAR
jgi:NhaP-type Na+/H+ or K+/H+ antiporter